MLGSLHDKFTGSEVVVIRHQAPVVRRVDSAIHRIINNG